MTFNYGLEEMTKVKYNANCMMHFIHIYPAAMMSYCSFVVCASRILSVQFIRYTYM